MNFFKARSSEASADALRILSVGQCGFDHRTIARVFKNRLGVKVIGSSTFTEASKALCSKTFQLVLINRVLNFDGTSGIEWIRRMKADPTQSETPVMLVSNYPDAQSQAEELGALPGFGKSSLHSATVLARLRGILQPVA